MNPPGAPRHWRDESSGELVRAIHHYLDNRRKLTFREVFVLKIYLRQWVDSPAWNAIPGASREKLEQLRADCKRISSQADVDRCVAGASELGMDPL